MKLITYCLGLMLLFLLSGCSKSIDAKTEPKEKKNIPLVDVQPVKIMDISEKADFTGNIVATKIARLSSPAEGPVKRLSVREGDYIKKGSVILTIGRTQSAEASLISAEEELKREEDELRAVKTLVESGAIPEEQLAKARANFAKAKAQLVKIQEGLGDYIIRAPWDGFISKLHITEGTFVAPRATLIEMFDPSSLSIQFSVPERVAASITQNTKLSVNIDAFPDRDFNAKISHIYPEMDLKTRSRIVEAKLHERPSVIPGMFVRIKAVLKTSTNTLVIPREALIQGPNDEKFLYTISEGKAIRKKIVTGIEDGALIEVLKGVDPKEQVIVAGNERLKNGIEVKVSGDKKASADSGDKAKGTQ